MMEFTLSRISACLCGVMVIALLFNPVVDSYDGKVTDLNGDCCQSLGRMFDSFMETETDEAFVALNIMLPDGESVISFEGNRLTMSNARGVWTYEMVHPAVSDSPSYGSNDLIVLGKSDGVMTVRIA